MVTDVNRTSIKKTKYPINTNFTFNLPKPLFEIKIGYILAKLEGYIPNPSNVIDVKSLRTTEIGALIIKRHC